MLVRGRNRTGISIRRSPQPFAAAHSCGSAVCVFASAHTLIALAADLFCALVSAQADSPRLAPVSALPAPRAASRPATAPGRASRARRANIKTRLDRAPVNSATQVSQPCTASRVRFQLCGSTRSRAVSRFRSLCRPSATVQVRPTPMSDPCRPLRANCACRDALRRHRAHPSAPTVRRENIRPHRDKSPANSAQQVRITMLRATCAADAMAEGRKKAFHDSRQFDFAHGFVRPPLRCRHLERADGPVRSGQLRQLVIPHAQRLFGIPSPAAATATESQARAHILFVCVFLLLF